MSINFSASHNPAGLTETNSIRSAQQAINPRVLSEPVSNVAAAAASKMNGGKRKRGGSTLSSRKIYPKYMIGRMGGGGTLSYSRLAKGGGSGGRGRGRHTRRGHGRRGRFTRRRRYRGGGCGCDTPFLHGGTPAPAMLMRGGRRRRSSSRRRRLRRGGGCGCGMPKLMGGAPAPRMLMRGGGYGQYMNNLPNTPSYSVGPPAIVGRDNVGMANPPPTTLIPNCATCTDNYKATTNSGFPSRGH